MEKVKAVDRVRSLIAFLKANGVNSILQVGCLDTEITINFVRSGFKVTVICSNPEKLSKLDKKMSPELYDIETLKISPEEIKSEKTFDFALAYNSIYFTDQKGFRATLDRLFKAVKIDGFFYFTLISTKHSLWGKGQEIETNTFTYHDQIHHFSDPAEIVPAMKHVEIVDMRHLEQDEPGSFHWHILGRNRDLFPDDKEENSNQA